MYRTETMAKRMGKSVATVKKLLSNVDQSNMTIDILFRFAKALDVPYMALIHIDCC